jgi:hypothetical protein
LPKLAARAVAADIAPAAAVARILRLDSIAFVPIEIGVGRSLRHHQEFRREFWTSRSKSINLGRRRS